MTAGKQIMKQVFQTERNEACESSKWPFEHECVTFMHLAA